MRHRSGPVELCDKMLEFIKCATGPDLWDYRISVFFGGNLILAYFGSPS